MIFFVSFLLFFVLILVEVRYDTAKSLSEDGKGFLTIRVSYGATKKRRAPACPLTGFAGSRSFYLYKISLTRIFLSPGKNNKW